MGEWIGEKGKAEGIWIGMDGSFFILSFFGE